MGQWSVMEWQKQEKTPRLDEIPALELDIKYYKMILKQELGWIPKNTFVQKPLNTPWKEV